MPFFMLIRQYSNILQNIRMIDKAENFDFIILLPKSQPTTAPRSQKLHRGFMQRAKK
jgi:hypothetical protein